MGRRIVADTTYRIPVKEEFKVAVDLVARWIGTGRAKPTITNLASWVVNDFTDTFLTLKDWERLCKFALNKKYRGEEYIHISYEGNAFAKQIFEKAWRKLEKRCGEELNKTQAFILLLAIGILFYKEQLKDLGIQIKDLYN